MGTRLINMQRQMRELGRLRTGYSGPKGPVRSKTWILTSKERDLLDAAAAEWGGKVVEWTPLNGDVKQWSLSTETDRLPAFLPPGDPLTQANEMWNRGGATRRCDGATESRSGKPCLCAAQFGDEWFRRSVREVCKPYSHLNVMLLGLPDVGYWRHTTKSYYAAAEIAGMVDLIKAQVGFEPIVPVWLIIDQRKKVADGTTTPYPVPIVKVRGAESGAALLSGRVPTLELGAPAARQAIAAAPAPEVEQAPDWLGLIAAAKTADDLNELKAQMQAANVRDAAIVTAWRQRGEAIVEAAKPTPTVQPAAEPAVEGEVEPDADEMFNRIVSAAPEAWGTSDLRARISTFLSGKDADDANGWELERFLKALKNGEVAS